MQTIFVDTRIAVADTTRKPLGINVNYLRDADANYEGCRPLHEVLRCMGVKYLRYPGGEKSDFHLFAGSINNRPDPQIYGSYRKFIEGYQVLDFDMFMEVVQAVGATAHIVVGYDSFARTGITRERYLENAVEWVRYANRVKKYDILSWEIGNENWHNNTGEPEVLAEIVSQFSQKMKQIDPGIRVGASGNSRTWWQRFLPAAADSLDFLTVSSYSCWDWKDYKYYADHSHINLMEQAETALNAIDAFVPGHKNRLNVVISELNSMDYSENGWPPANNLGHSLVTFEMIGQMLLNPRIDYGMIWNTRWIEETKHDLLWYALDDQNALLPPGRILAVWGQFLLSQLVSITRTPEIVTFASYDPASSQLNLFLVNKSRAGQDVCVAVDGHTYSSSTIYCYQGSGPDDMHPVWSCGRNQTVINQIIDHLVLPPVSLSVIQLL